MTTEVTYIACDGTRFEEKWKCEEYEKDLEIQGLKDTLLCFDENGSPLSLNDMEYIADNVKYVVIKSQKAYEYISNELARINSAYPNEYTAKTADWNISFVLDDKCIWIPCEIQITYFLSQIKILQKYVDMTK